MKPAVIIIIDGISYTHAFDTKEEAIKEFDKLCIKFAVDFTVDVKCYFSE